MLTAAAGISSATGSWLPAMGRDRGSTTGSLKRPQSSPEKGECGFHTGFSPKTVPVEAHILGLGTVPSFQCVQARGR